MVLGTGDGATELNSAERASGTQSDGRLGPVPALNKAIAIVRALNAAPSLGLTLSDLSQSLALTKSHCHNILKTFLAEGWVTFDPDRRRYALAPRLLSDISRLVARQDHSALIHGEIVRLSAAARVPCVVTRVDPDGSFVAIDKAEEAAELLVSVPIGHRFAADAPAQMRARLAFSCAEIRRAFLERWQPVAYTAATITDKAALEAELEATRRRGYAVSREEFSPGVTSFAVPILNARGEVHMIVQCPGLAAAIEPLEATITRELIATGRRIGAIYAE